VSNSYLDRVDEEFREQMEICLDEDEKTYQVALFEAGTLVPPPST
jgi:hypothetical protein